MKNMGNNTFIYLGMIVIVALQATQLIKDNNKSSADFSKFESFLSKLESSLTRLESLSVNNGSQTLSAKRIESDVSTSAAEHTVKTTTAQDEKLFLRLKTLIEDTMREASVVNPQNIAPATTKTGYQAPLFSEDESIKAFEESRAKLLSVNFQSGVTNEELAEISSYTRRMNIKELRRFHELLAEMHERGEVDTEILFAIN